MDKLTTYTICQRCLGTGINGGNIPPGVDENPCSNCKGTGYVNEGIIDFTLVMTELDWIKKKIKKILNKLDIPEE